MKRSEKLLLLFAACLSTIVLAVINSSHGSMMESITNHYLGGDGASQGYPNTAMQVGCIIAVLLFMFFGGKLAKSGKTLLLVISAALIAVCMMVLGAAPSFAVFVLTFAFIGLAYGAIDVVASALVADAYGSSSAGMMCLLHGSHGAAGIVAPLLVGAGLSALAPEKWSTIYIFTGVFVAFVLVYVLIVFVLGRKSGANAPKQSSKGFIPFDKKLIPIALPILFYGVYLVGMISYTEQYETSLREGGTTVTLSLLYLGLTASRLALPLLHIPPRMYLRFAPIISSVLLAVGIISGNSLVYIICASLAALISGGFIPVAISEACVLLPESTTGASTWMNLLMMTGNMVSPPLIGAISGSFGIGAALFVPAAALALAAACSFIKITEK